MVDIIVRSWINFDGYECCGKSFNLSQIDELKEMVAGKVINWYKGKNTFTGELVSDDFMLNMISRYHGWDKEKRDVL